MDLSSVAELDSRHDNLLSRQLLLRFWNLGEKGLLGERLSTDFPVQ